MTFVRNASMSTGRENISSLCPAKGVFNEKEQNKRVLLQMTLILAAAASLYGCSRDGEGHI